MVALAKHPLATESVLSSIRSAGSGAAPLSKDIALAVEKKTDPAFDVVSARYHTNHKIYANLVIRMSSQVYNA